MTADDGTDRLFEQLRRDYAEGVSPLSLIRAFLLSREFQESIPEWVLDGVAKGFAQFLESDGKTSLEKCFNFGWGGGKRAREKEVMSVRDFFVMRDVWKLQNIGVSIEKAAEMVAAKQEGCVWAFDRVEVEPLGADTIQARYIREQWRDRLTPMLEHLGFAQWLSPTDKKEFLASFPKDFIPPDLK